MWKTGTVILCLTLLVLPAAAAQHISVTHEEGHEENPVQDTWENIKQFLKDLLPAPIVFFFENWDKFKGNESSDSEN